MEKIDLKYGSEHIEIQIDGAKSIKYLKENPMKEIEDIASLFKKSVEDDAIQSENKS